MDFIDIAPKNAAMEFSPAPILRVRPQILIEMVDAERHTLELAHTQPQAQNFPLQGTLGMEK